MYKRNIPVLMLVLAGLVLLPLSCGNNLDDDAARVLKKVYGWKAGENFFALTNCFILSSDFSNGNSADMLRLGKIWINATRKGSVEKIEILKNHNDGHTANILYNLYFLDGSEELSNMALLIKIGSLWKLSLH